MTPLSRPEALADAHDFDAFDCGEEVLNSWLKRRARANQLTGASRTFVVRRGAEVVGYYALAAGAIASSDAPSRLKRNMPDPIPVFILGRLAVDRREQGNTLGSLLLRDAALRTLKASEFGGVAGMLVHAISEPARRFYANRGFVECPNNPMTLVVRIKDIAAIVGATG